MCRECSTVSLSEELDKDEQVEEKGNRVLRFIINLPKYMALGLIRFYQTVISPLTPPTCRFYPTCSEYALTSFRRYGFAKGFVLTVKRLSKCHPFHPGGYDPVP